MTLDPLALLVDLDTATNRLLATAGKLPGDEAVAEPSLLPGWTRGHVLAHVARNADSMINLLTWARTGVVTPQYPSREHRAAGIEAGAGRPLAEQLADVRDSADRFARAAADMPAEAWLAEIDLPAGRRAGAYVVWGRLREVEIHHVDLAAGYGPADWPASFAHRLLHEVTTELPGPAMTVRPDGVAHTLAVGPGGPPTIAGPVEELAAWLAGRSTGARLTVDPPGALPAVPDWK